MKRTMTAEQVAASAARKAKFREFARKIGAMPAPERAALAASLPAIATVEGRSLSPFNQCLIASQCSTATLVGGFRQWLKAGRCVRKGEHGLGLWIPCKGAKSADGEEGDTHFIMGSVFDVSQTAELGAVTEQQAEAAEVSPVPTPTAEQQGFTVGGYYSTESTEIRT